MAAKHFMMYYKRGTGTFVVTEPRPWAKENQTLFPDYDFIERVPTTNTVEQLLINQYDFQKVVENEDVVLIQNVDTNLNL
jgi:hypothetical protein